MKKALTLVVLIVTPVMAFPQGTVSLTGLGSDADGFGFTVTGPCGTVVMVDACTNLASPVWISLQNCTLTNEAIFFRDGASTNSPARFYRIYARSLTSGLFHQQANRTIPMGIMWPGYGRNYANHALILGVAQSLNTNGLVQHGYNTVLMNCGTLSSSRDANGDLQIGQPTVINVTNLVSELLTNGCYLGFHFYATVPGGTLDECNSLVLGPTSVYHDGFTIGSWGVRQVWEGGTGFIPEADFRFISEAFHAGLYDGAVAGGWPYVPNSMVSSGEDRNYRWVPEVWNLPYVRASGGPDMSTVGITAWQYAFFFSMRNYSWIFTEGSSPSLEGFVVHDTGGDSTDWVTTNALRSIFGMECMNSMPLYIAGSSVLPGEMTIITNDAAIAIDQDQLRGPPYVVSSNATSAVVTKQLLNGDVAVALWNLSTNSATAISVSLASVPGVHSNIMSVVDIFDGCISAATNTLAATVNKSGLNLYRLLSGP